MGLKIHLDLKRKKLKMKHYHSLNKLFKKKIHFISHSNKISGATVSLLRWKIFLREKKIDIEIHSPEKIGFKNRIVFLIKSKRIFKPI